MGAARQLLKDLDPSQRPEALQDLLGELGRADPRFTGWRDNREALKSLLMLRVR